MPFHSTKDFKMRKDILKFAPQQLEPVSILRQSWKIFNEFKRFENALQVRCGGAVKSAALAMAAPRRNDAPKRARQSKATL